MSTNTPHLLWTNLATSAVVGLEKQPFSLPESDDPLGEMLSQIEAADQERRFLTAAACVSVYNDAGKLPAQAGDTLLAACDLDDLPAVSPRAGECLASIISGEFEEALPEWLETVAARGMRVPAMALPMLLDYGQRKREVRDAILLVLGKRGLWLAARNPDWSYAVVGESEECWETGTRAERASLLRRMRSQDPNRAREMLVATWEEDTPEDRAAFLGELLTGLSMDDEPFLETALDDRRKEVRKAASELLSRLPQSRFCARMMERVGPLLSFSAGQKAKFLIGGRKASIDLSLPANFDKAMARDGIEQKSKINKLSDKSSQALQMIAALPPSYWCRLWNVSPAELVEAGAGSDWDTVLLPAWALAAQRYRDPEWAEALIMRVADNWYSTDAFDLRELMYALPHDRLENLVLSNLAAGNKGKKSALYIAQFLKHSLSPGFSREIIGILRQHISSGNQTWEGMPDQFAYQISPVVIPEAVTLLTRAVEGSIGKDSYSDNAWRRYIQRMITVLEFRNEMHY